MTASKEIDEDEYYQGYEPLKVVRFYHYSVPHRNNFRYDLKDEHKDIQYQIVVSPQLIEVLDFEESKVMANVSFKNVPLEAKSYPLRTFSNLLLSEDLAPYTFKVISPEFYVLEVNGLDTKLTEMYKIKLKKTGWTIKFYNSAKRSKKHIANFLFRGRLGTKVGTLKFHTSLNDLKYYAVTLSLGLAMHLNYCVYNNITSPLHFKPEELSHESKRHSAKEFNYSTLKILDLKIQGNPKSWSVCSLPHNSNN